MTGGLELCLAVWGSEFSSLVFCCFLPHSAFFWLSCVCWVEKRKGGGIGTRNVPFPCPNSPGAGRLCPCPPTFPHFHLLSVHAAEGCFLWKPVTPAFAVFHLERHPAATEGWWGEALGHDALSCRIRWEEAGPGWECDPQRHWFISGIVVAP